MMWLKFSDWEWIWEVHCVSVLENVEIYLQKDYYANGWYIASSLCQVRTVGHPNYLNSCYFTHAARACACLGLCYALHHCSKIDFLRLSHYTEGRKQVVLVSSTQAWMLCSDKLCFSDTCQGALLLPEPPSGCADVRACLCVCSSFLASLMHRFLRLFVFSQMGGWLCTGDSCEISFRGHWVLIKYSLEIFTSMNISPVSNKNEYHINTVNK